LQLYLDNNHKIIFFVNNSTIVTFQ